jgi:hypothetical protein
MKSNIKKLNIPEDSVWDRKTYNPYVLLDRWVYNHFRTTTVGNYICGIFDNINAFVRGVKNLIKWGPTIYNDYNWDYRSIYDVLYKKIELLRKNIVQNNRHTGVEADNFWMTLSLNLINKVKDEEYTTEYFDYIDKDFSFDKIDKVDQNGGNLYEMNTTVISDNTEEYVKKNPSKVRILSKKFPNFAEKTNEDKAMLISRYKQDQAKKLLFRIIETKIEYWWD